MAAPQCSRQHGSTTVCVPAFAQTAFATLTSPRALGSVEEEEEFVRLGSSGKDTPNKRAYPPFAQQILAFLMNQGPVGSIQASPIMQQPCGTDTNRDGIGAAAVLRSVSAETYES